MAPAVTSVPGLDGDESSTKDGAPAEGSSSAEDVSPAERPSPAEDPSVPPARVPWLRYHDRPVRTAPSPAAQPSEEPAPRRAPSAQPVPGPNDPLLTKAELDALLEDDSAASGPDKTDVLPTGRDSGGDIRS